MATFYFDVLGCLKQFEVGVFFRHNFLELS